MLGDKKKERERHSKKEWKDEERKKDNVYK